MQMLRAHSAFIVRSQMGLAVLVLLCSFFSWPLLASSRKKTDVVYMENGDKITGEIQSLDKGQLSVKPDYAVSAILLDWSKVDHLESSQDFVITDTHGVVYSGTLAGKHGTTDIIVLEPRQVVLTRENIVEIDQLGSTFLRRLRGNVDLGTSVSQSSSQDTLTLQSGLSYQSEKYLYSLTSSTQFTAQKAAENTNETTVKATGLRRLKKSNWYAGGIANFLSSTEQQIAWQSTLGAVLAKRIISTNRTDLNAIGGLGYANQQNSAGSRDTAPANSIDSAFAIQYSTFRFDSTNFDTTVWVYPSLTNAGRVRMTLNQDVYYKFLGDFYVRFSFYDNYDNQPVAGAPANNLGGTTSVGWSFH